MFVLVYNIYTHFDELIEILPFKQLHCSTAESVFIVLKIYWTFVKLVIYICLNFVDMMHFLKLKKSFCKIKCLIYLPAILMMSMITHG